MTPAVLDALVAARGTRRAIALATRLADGAQCLVDAGRQQGELALGAAALDEIRTRLRGDRSGVIEADPGVFARIYAPAPRLILVGAVHIAQHLAAMAARIGFEVTIVDPRAAFGTAERFPGVALSGEWPDAALAALAPDVHTAVVVLAHDPKLDDPALVVALRSAAFYVGALGSRRTHAKRVLRLEALGLGPELARLHAPAGLDLGGRSPAEIALSILAEVTQQRYAPREPG